MSLARWVLPLFLFLVSTLSPCASAANDPSVLSLIGVAEQAVAQGDDRRAETLLSRVPSGSVDGVQLARLQLVRAEIGRLRQQPDTILRALPSSSEHVPSLAARIEALRAEAHFRNGNAVAAVRALVERERWLRAPEELTDNRDRIWRGLIAQPLPSDAFGNLERESPMVRGWLDLASVLQRGPSQAALSAWAARNPGHPATSRMALVRSGEDPIPAQGPAPGPGPSAGQVLPGFMAGGVTGGAGSTIAVLLPLSGSLSGGGLAIRDGLVAAWFSAPRPRPTLRFYDTRGDAGAALVAWETAVQDGADMMIGPLIKPGVSHIARQGTPRPWVALNYVDEPLSGALQFGLAPEDEARAAALDALGSDRRQALVLIPDNSWGARVLQAFTETYESQGGRVLDSASIASGTQDFGSAMRGLLKLEGSRSRHRQLTQVLGVSSEFEPRPRQDANVLFAPLRADEIRALAPQLAFFRAGRLSAYVISAAHAGQVDEQLEGLKLCDMPWVMSDGGPLDERRARDALNFPQTVRSQPRLFALGRDAYALANGMLRGNLHHMQDVGGATGQLRVNPGGRVSRVLSCSEVRDGRARAGTLRR